MVKRVLLEMRNGDMAGFMPRDGEWQRPICLLGHFVESMIAPDFSFKPSPLHLTFCHPHAAFLYSGVSPHDFSKERANQQFLFYFVLEVGHLNSIFLFFSNIYNLGI